MSGDPITDTQEMPLNAQPTPTPTPAATAPAAKPKLDWISAIKSDDKETINQYIKNEINDIIHKNNLSNYTTIMLVDEVDSISNYHADQIYAAATESDIKDDILLIINSGGGGIEPAYLLSKTLKRLSCGKFVVAVPRRAKSAATLICLGADEIHMGLMSHLGPIDPQMGGLPALALGNALNVIAELACQFPGAAEIFKDYLRVQAPIRNIGYYQRVNESAVQYAERLLQSRTFGSNHTSETVAKHLVNHYKDHGFVIDIDEATELLGSDMIKINSFEYKAADEIYRMLDFIGFVMAIEKKKYWHVGSVETGFGYRNDKNQYEN
ncbi:ATP-dependent Clp protease proteolytic subunit [Methylobacterium sp. E-016]|uniref:SDH family Clp fold serine proteinase n=1 Tax=Methylobacterium sp. E-016 TaxID=2836556 RepID=UPI001FBADC86|nr:ATP-dependent Clp protease proteolytic subunit [Methylobacterium sp. E-016]MCJ2075684.1 ATP-dependent Clp protease proteolytic subunit [Methylobacterium sp. E-016]